MVRPRRAPAVAPIRDFNDLRALSGLQQARRARALEAVELARTKRISRKAAAEEARVSVAEVMLYTGPAWKHKGDRWVPKAYDKLYRGKMNVLTPQGRVTLEVSDSRTAALILEHRRRAKLAYSTGNYRELRRRFRGKRIHVNGVAYELATDPQLIRMVGLRGELDYEAYDDAA